MKDAQRGSECAFPHPKRAEDPIYESSLFARRVRKNSGVDFKAHDFRRTAASLMAETGTPRLVIGKILNHVEPGVTKIYDRHSYDREKQKALNAWGVRLSSIVSGPEPEEKTDLQSDPDLLRSFLIAQIPPNP